VAIGGSVQEYIDKYQSFLNSKQAPQNTMDAYLSDINIFHRFCIDYFDTEEVDIQSIETRTIRDYLISLLREKKTNKTISRNVSALKMFFKYLLLHEYITKNPMKGIKNPKVSKKLPMFFSEVEIQKLCDLPDTKTFKGIRDKAILELFYSSGLRISELTNMRLTDLDTKQKIVTVIGKGDKQRRVPVTDVAIHWMQKYQQVRNNPHTAVFFLSMRNNPMTRREVYTIIKKYINHLGLKQGYSPHTLRHSFASHLLNHGADLFAIKEMLGHASVGTTEIYTHLNSAVIRQEYLNGHPRGRK